MTNKPYKVVFPQHGDERGWLVVVEGQKDIPFEIKRIFYIYGSDSTVVRGKHANRRSQFALVNVSGSCKVRVRDGRDYDEIFVIDQPHEGVYLPEMYWKEMYDFSSDSVLLCISSEAYDAEEYIRNYEDYCRMVKENDC